MGTDRKRKIGIGSFETSWTKTHEFTDMWQAYSYGRPAMTKLACYFCQRKWASMFLANALGFNAYWSQLSSNFSVSRGLSTTAKKRCMRKHLQCAKKTAEMHNSSNLISWQTPLRHDITDQVGWFQQLCCASITRNSCNYNSKRVVYSSNS